MLTNSLSSYVLQSDNFENLRQKIHMAKLLYKLLVIIIPNQQYKLGPLQKLLTILVPKTFLQPYVLNISNENS